MQTPIRKAGKYTFPPIDHHLTAAKLAEVAQALERLKRSRPRLAEEVKRLGELGDFSENAAYAMAKGHLRRLNQNILNLEAQVKHAVLITPNKTSSTVQLGNRVTIASGGKQHTYLIVGSAESNPTKGRISHHSPVGRALLGRKVGDTVELRLNNQTVTYTILKIA